MITFPNVDHDRRHNYHHRLRSSSSDTSLKVGLDFHLKWTFELSQTKHLRGHTFKLVKHISNLKVRRQFFTERHINRWNNLDQHTLDVDSVNRSKNHLQRLRNTPGAVPGGVQGVRTPTLLIMVPFLKEHIFNLHVLAEQGASPVSYTHLTLPTKRIV